jgi:hypothetical protein
MSYEVRIPADFRPAASEEALFRKFLRCEHERLADAAKLLGGEAWRERVLAIHRAVSMGIPSSRIQAELRELRDLLMLAPTDDPFSVESARYMRVHPDDPRAANAMRCAEALERGLDTLDRLAAVRAA